MVFLQVVFLLIAIALAFRFKFVRDILGVSVITMTLSFLAYKVSNTELFSVYVYPESFVLSNFEPSDYAFSRLRSNPEIDKRIILVNIGTLNRRDIAEQICSLSRFKPRVIAIDALFNCPGGLRDSMNCLASIDTIGNQMLGTAIREAGNVILASTLRQSKHDGDLLDSVEISDPMFSDYSLEGFVNLPSNDLRLVRSIFPKRRVKDLDHLGFGVQIAMQYDSARALKFLARDNEEELINFRGNISVNRVEPGGLAEAPTYPTMFYAVDYDQLLRGEALSEMFRDNIVIMGYLGDYLGDSAFEDKFFTPLNKMIAGGADPDMFGPVVHANVVSMILNDDYIDELSTFHEFLVGFYASLVHVALLLLILRHWQIWYDLLAIGLVIIQLAIFSWARMQLFILWGIKAQFGIGLATLAIASVVVVMYKELFPHIGSRFLRGSLPKDPTPAP